MLSKMTNTQQNGPKSMTAGGGVWQYRKLFYACHRSSARKEVCHPVHDSVGLHLSWRRGITQIFHALDL